jgi:hypothetical protein
MEVPCWRMIYGRDRISDIAVKTPICSLFNLTFVRKFSSPVLCSDGCYPIVSDIDDPVGDWHLILVAEL